MKFALHFANTTFPKPEDAKRLALAAEAAGFESVTVPTVQSYEGSSFQVFVWRRPVDDESGE